MRSFAIGIATLSLLAALLLSLPGYALAAPTPPTLPIPAIQFGIQGAQSPGDVALSLQILALLTILSLAPGIILMLTSFTRIVVVLGFVRNAAGLQQVPPNQVVTTLALFLTFFTMSPVGKKFTTGRSAPT